MRCLCATVRRTGRLLTRKYEDALRPSGLSVSQFELMAMVRGMQPVDQTTVANELETDQTTLSRNLKLLLAQGWLEVVMDERDGRRRCYQLTSTGGEVLRSAKQCWDGVHAEMEGLLGMPMSEVWPLLERIQDAARG